MCVVTCKAHFETMIQTIIVQKNVDVISPSVIVQKRFLQGLLGTGHALVGDFVPRPVSFIWNQSEEDDGTSTCRHRTYTNGSYQYFEETSWILSELRDILCFL